MKLNLLSLARRYCFLETNILTADCLQIPLCRIENSKNRVDKMLFLWSNKDCKWKLYPIIYFCHFSKMTGMRNVRSIRLLVLMEQISRMIDRQFEYYKGILVKNVSVDEEDVMTLRFTKMHGCGNDYIYFNCMEQEIPLPEQLAITLSDRHFGIGGDGIVLICPSAVADAKMRMFNADGSEGKMCGNAIRCVGKYLYEHGIVKKSDLTIETLSGIKSLQLMIRDDKVAAVQVNMGAAEMNPKKIPVLISRERIVGYPVEIGGRSVAITCVSIGNPHCVVFCDNPDLLPLEEIGPQFEKHPLFPEQVNTEFVQVIDSATLKMRVWERGSGETWACGTGACAAAVAAVENGYASKDTDILVRLRGGELSIRYTDHAVWMTGEAVSVFEGCVEVSLNTAP